MYRIWLIDAADAGLKDILWGLLEEIERERKETVTKQEFVELSEIVRYLGQKTSELADKVDSLAEAQKRTEQKIGELAEAQKRTEQKVEKLAERVEELAEAQKRTEQKVEKLTERVEELAMAQKRTEEELRELVSEHRETRRQLGGLTMTVGYGLEDKAYPALPGLLQRDFGLVVQERLVRRFVTDKKGNDIEVNIFGKAVRNGEEFMIIGEAKSQLSKNNIESFLRKRVRRFEDKFDNLFPVLVTYMISSPEVEVYAKEQGVTLYYSYDF